MARSWLYRHFTFTHPDDVAEYGDEPYLYDESLLAGMSARDLVELEGVIGMPVVDAMNGMRDSLPMPTLAVTWWALGQAGRDVDLDKYNPHTLMIEWTPAQVDRGKAPEPEPLPVPEPEPLPVPESAPTIALPSLPRAD